MSVQYSAWKPGGPYNCTATLYLYDATLGYYVASASQRTPFYEQDFFAAFSVMPGHTYFVVMYITCPQAAPNYWTHNRIFQVYDGYVPFGTRIKQLGHNRWQSTLERARNRQAGLVCSTKPVRWFRAFGSQAQTGSVANSTGMVGAFDPA